MSNTLVTLSAALAVQLHDQDGETWGPDERDDLLIWAVASLWPKCSYELDPSATTVTLVADTYYYALPTGVKAISRIDWKDSYNEERGPVSGRLWELFGNKIHVSPKLVAHGGTLRLLGYGQYDTSTNPVGDDLVPLVLAMARSEAYRRMAGDRVQFEKWQAANQTQNVSVTELWRLLGEANVEIERLWRRAGTMRRPVQGRHG